MDKMIACLVAANGDIIAVNGEHDHGLMADFCEPEVNANDYLWYWFDLQTRKVECVRGDKEGYILPFEPKQSHDQAAQAFFDTCAETPADLMEYVKAGNWWHQGKQLIPLLTDSAQKIFKAYSAESSKVFDSAMEKITEAWEVAAKPLRDKYNDPTNATVGNDLCQIACDRDDAENAAYADMFAFDSHVWINLFSHSENRIEIWK